MLIEEDFKALHEIKRRASIEFADWIYNSKWSKNANGVWEHSYLGQLKTTDDLYMLFIQEDISYSST